MENNDSWLYGSSSNFHCPTFLVVDGIVSPYAEVFGAYSFSPSEPVSSPANWNCAEVGCGVFSFRRTSIKIRLQFFGVLGPQLVVMANESFTKVVCLLNKVVRVTLTTLGNSVWSTYLSLRVHGFLYFWSFSAAKWCAVSFKHLCLALLVLRRILSAVESASYARVARRMGEPIGRVIATSDRKMNIWHSQVPISFRILHQFKIALWLRKPIFASFPPFACRIN